MGRCNKLSSVRSLPCHPNCYVYMASNTCIDNSLELTNGQWKVLGLNSKSRAIWYLYIRYLHIRGQKVTAYVFNWVILVRSKRANSFINEYIPSDARNMFVCSCTKYVFYCVILTWPLIAKSEIELCTLLLLLR